MSHKAGFVNIIGNPNVGKSTLMNQLVGEKLSIITSKSQTTRHRIAGIVNEEGYQIVFSDTPGMLKPAYKLQEGMMGFVNNAMLDADIFLVVVDIFQKDFEDENVYNRLKNAEVPVLLLLNKIDLGSQERITEDLERWKQNLPNAEILPISALNNFNTDKILDRIIELLPENEPFYPKDALTDKSERFFVEEKIREKILENYNKEVPYSCEVVVEDFKEEEKIIRIRAEIYVSRDTQKGIIIGHKGEKLKKVGTQARKDLEVFFDKKIFLELYVKVNKNWRDDAKKLKGYGYL